MLTGHAKTDYQREYMRKRRSNKSNARSNKVNGSVRPDPRLEKIYVDAAGGVPIKTQSHSPMMVGYVPPKD